MRPSLLIACATLAIALGACRDRGQAGQNRSADAGLTADDIVSNDVTAIDAVTADAANMAADVDYSDSLNALSSNGSDAAKPPARPVAARPAAKPAARPSPRAAPSPAPDAAGNSATNAQ